ncbi:hypothetical protein ACHAXM_009786 [Skeletonema potamos]
MRYFYTPHAPGRIRDRVEYARKAKSTPPFIPQYYFSFNEERITLRGVSARLDRAWWLFGGRRGVTRCYLGTQVPHNLMCCVHELTTQSSCGKRETGMERKLFSPFCETLMFMTLACQKEKIEYIVGRVWYYIRIIQKQEVCIVLSLYYLSPRARALSLSLVQSESTALYVRTMSVRCCYVLKAPRFHSFLPSGNGQVVSASSMPILSPHAIPILFINLNFTLSKFCIQSKMRQLYLYTVSGYSVEE